MSSHKFYGQTRLNNMKLFVTCAMKHLKFRWVSVAISLGMKYFISKNKKNAQNLKSR